jgi:hypothetical protein
VNILLVIQHRTFESTTAFESLGSEPKQYYPPAATPKAIRTTPTTARAAPAPRRAAQPRIVAAVPFKVQRPALPDHSGADILAGHGAGCHGAPVPVTVYLGARERLDIQERREDRSRLRLRLRGRLPAARHRLAIDGESPTAQRAV